jgi:hypothetical protein
LSNFRDITLTDIGLLVFASVILTLVAMTKRGEGRQPLLSQWFS